MSEGREGTPSPMEAESREDRSKILNRIDKVKRTFEENPSKIKKIQEGFKDISKGDEYKKEELIGQISELVTPYEISVHYMQTLKNMQVPLELSLVVYHHRHGYPYIL